MEYIKAIDIYNDAIDSPTQNDDFHIQQIQVELVSPPPTHAPFPENSPGENQIIKFLKEKSPFENETITLVSASFALLIFVGESTIFINLTLFSSSYLSLSSKSAAAGTKIIGKTLIFLKLQPESTAILNAKLVH
jgi:hypothetical protein